MSVDKNGVVRSYGTLLRNVPEVEAQAGAFIVGVAPAHLLDTVSLPTSFDGRVVWKKYLSPIKSQGHCGMCYSCSTVGALADRYSILTLGDVHMELSASDMVMCMLIDPKNIAITQTTFDKKGGEEYHKQEITTREKYACLGNTLYNAAKYLFIEGAPSEKCVPDSLVTAVTDNANLPFCEDVEGQEFDHCSDTKNSQRYYRAGKVYQLPYNANDIDRTEKQIMMDIYKWGPIAAGFLIFEDFLNNYDGTTIYTTKNTGAATLGHAVRIVGWGEENQGGRVVKYWICANSWSEDWGDKGYFKVERFLPGIDLEKNIVSLIPDLPGVASFDQQYDSTTMITEEDKKARRLLGVSLYTLYPASAIDKIKDGLLLGDLNNLIVNPADLPRDYSTFIAGRIDTYNLNELRNKPRGALVWLWTLLSLVLAFIAGGLVTYWWLKHKNRIN